MADHLETGAKGEEIARRFLAEKGYQILETNWRAGFHEIDIIARKGGFLVVVEVKTRKGKPLVEPEEAVDMNKQKLLIKAANKYIELNNVSLETRFDIIGIIMQGENYQVNHIEDAFYPRLRR
ncbi:MAG: YraN family protein [Bacteroidales bacterium]